MLPGEPTASEGAPPSRAGRLQQRARRRRSRRAVAEVVATIILLALTVVLFAAIFAFVTSFPPPPPQNSNQFQAKLTLGTNASSGCSKTSTTCNPVITAVSILHLAGPVVVPSALVYLKSSTIPMSPQFNSPYTLAQGGIPSGTVWNLGQSWVYAFPTGLQPVTTAIQPNNISVYIISSNSLLFSVTLPGQSFSFPPSFLATAVSPSTPTVGQAFNVTATVSGATSGSVYVNLQGIPGFTSTPVKKMTYAAATGQYYLLVTSSIGVSTSNGTYYLFFNASGTGGTSGSTALAITINPSTTTGSTTAALAVSPTQGVPGGTVTVSGSNFADSAAVSMTFGGTALTLSACTLGTLAGGKVTTTTSGTFSCSFTIPSPSGGAGTYPVVASITSPSQSATALFAVTTPAIVASPTSLAPSASLAVTGTGFSVSSTVLIYFKDGATNTTVGTSTNPCTSGSLITTGTGTFACTFTVPSGAGKATATLSVEDVATGKWVTESITVT
ncbi:MAG TPA: type IV pilin [Thermoplasmata archaeon]|nr:type IV pilin [Thermoplasmata archaeon]